MWPAFDASPQNPESTRPFFYCPLSVRAEARFRRFLSHSVSWRGQVAPAPNRARSQQEGGGAGCSLSLAMEATPEPEPVVRPCVARRRRAAGWLRRDDRVELEDQAHGGARQLLVRAPTPFSPRALHEPEAAHPCATDFFRRWRCFAQLGESSQMGLVRRFA